MPRLPAVSSALITGLTILYPVIAVASLRFWGPGAAFVILVVLIGARAVLPSLSGIPSSLGLVLLPVLAALFAVGLYDRQLSVRLYPVFMSLAMLAAFAVTLWQPPSMIERFARIFEPELPPSGVRYTFRVTQIWIGFFLINAAIALWTVLEPGWSRWMLYNGLVSYLAAGTLMGGEYVVRQFVRRT